MGYDDTGWLLIVRSTRPVTMTIVVEPLAGFHSLATSFDIIERATVFIQRNDKSIYKSMLAGAGLEPN